MSVEVASAALHPPLAQKRVRRRITLEHVVMAGAIVCLIVLVVLPLLSLLLGSVRGPEGMSLDHFGEVLTGRLYVNALKNSLILGAWTGLFSLIIGLTLAWAVSRTDVPFKPLLQITATRLLPVAAIPHGDRLHLSVQSQCRADQRADARRARAALAHLQHFLDVGARAGHGDAHLPVRLSAGIERPAVGRCLL